nr:hypothetical protein [Tanacetum cinerariifolium]
IKARVKADEELTQRLQAEGRNKYNKVDQEKILVVLINQKKRSNIQSLTGRFTLKNLENTKRSSRLKAFNRDDLVMLWSLVKERFSLTEPTDDKERTLWIKLKRLFEPNTDDTLWKLQSNQSRSYEVYDYKYLEDIEVRREDCQLYNFKEGDFPRHHLHDIEDMLLLLVQKKLSNLERDVIFDLGVELRIFTRRIVILKQVKDLQLGVKSYQKKLNITKLETFRLMRTDELYKFSDRTLTSVRSVLHNIASNLRMDYLPKRRWSSLDRKRSRIMIKAIDQQLLERRLMRILEKFVGERDYGEDL